MRNYGRIKNKKITYHKKLSIVNIKYVINLKIIETIFNINKKIIKYKFYYYFL